MAKKARTEEVPFRIMLFSGTVFLLDKQQRRIPATIGQEISKDRFHQIELAPGSKLYLQKHQRLLQLESSGKTDVAELERTSGSIFTSTLQFLASLSKPRSYTSQVKARGIRPAAPDDPVFFDQMWEQIVLSNNAPLANVSQEDALATAAWYHQQGRSARTAFILEHLDNTTYPKNPFFQQLRNDSLRGVPLADINTEVEQTRLLARGKLDTFQYKALLIGINQYDHPAWQPLDNPIADIRALRTMLIDQYRFQPEDVTSLENPTFDEIIDSFQHLKKEVNDKTRLIIYYAGHGFYPADEEEGYWIPRDGGDPATQRFFIPTSIILSKMKAIKSKHTLLITDSCFSGSLIRKSRGAVVDSGFYRELSEKRSRQIITSGGLEPVSDSGGGNHSVFAGNLLQILSETRGSPLSASELAIELRKSLKNAGVSQTPEYGRLYTADDENGEFFFVSKDQPLVYAENQRPVQSAPDPEKLREAGDIKNGLDIIGMENPPENDGSAFQAMDSEIWGNIGLFFHQAFLEYNYLYSASNETPRKIKVSASLEGAGLKAEYRKTNHKSGYGVIFDFGTLTGIRSCTDSDSPLSEVGIQTCDEEDRKDNEDTTALSGTFSHLGFFADYSVLVWKRISVQLGGAVQYQYYKLDNFLEKDSVDSSTLGACGKSGVAFRNKGWITRAFIDFCVTTFEFSGSLHELDEDYAGDIRLRANMNAGISAGFQF